jgi:uncharacterized protein
MKCLYHGSDPDGQAGAAIAYRFFKQSAKQSYTFIPVFHEKPFPWEALSSEEDTLLIDFTLNTPEEFHRLDRFSKNVIWIDHHQTGIDIYDHMGLHWDGLRDSKHAACRLAWKYFFPEVPVPRAIRLIEDYDIWAGKYGSASKGFRLACNLIDLSPKSKTWDSWLSPDYTPTQEIKTGEAILQHKKMEDQRAMEERGTKGTWEGHTALFCNIESPNDLLELADKDIKVVITFVHTGPAWKVSLRARQEAGVNVGQLAQKYGGGGHKLAAGFVCKKLPDNFPAMGKIKSPPQQMT